MFMLGLSRLKEMLPEVVKPSILMGSSLVVSRILGDLQVLSVAENKAEALLVRSLLCPRIVEGPQLASRAVCRYCSVSSPSSQACLKLFPICHSISVMADVLCLLPVFVLVFDLASSDSLC